MTGETLREWEGARGLTIGQVSERAGLPAKTIRYYESVGLLPRPQRGENHYRRYSRGDVNRLLLLRRIRLLGVPLSQAKALLAGATDARCVDAQDALLTLVADRLRALDQQIADLTALRDHIHDYRRELESCRIDSGASFQECPDMRCIGAPPEADSAEVCPPPLTPSRLTPENDHENSAHERASGAQGREENCCATHHPC